MAVRRELDANSNAHVNKVASRLKNEFADLLKFGREMGIRGFDEVSENMNYMTRRHRIQALDDLVARDSSGNIHRLVAGSIQSANKKWMMPEWPPNRWQRSPNKVRFQIDSSERERIRQAKWRLDIDETYSKDIIGKDGVKRSVTSKW